MTFFNLIKFEKLVEQVLLEMPHIASKESDPLQYEFDFEVETYAPGKDGYHKLVQHVNKFLNGERCPARREDRADTIYVLAPESREAFIKAMENNNILILMLKKRFQKEMSEFIADLKLN